MGDILELESAITARYALALNVAIKHAEETGIDSGYLKVDIKDLLEKYQSKELAAVKEEFDRYKNQVRTDANRVADLVETMEKENEMLRNAAQKTLDHFLESSCGDLNNLVSSQTRVLTLLQQALSACSLEEKGKNLDAET